MPLGLLAAGALAAAGGLGMAAARAIPGKLERNYRKQITADQKRLSGGAGGMSAGEREQARAEGVGAIQAQQAQERAQLARGAASGQAASGQRAEALASSQRAAHGARNQLDSSVRDQDLMVGAHQRQMLQQRQLAAIRMGQKRKKDTLDAIQNSGMTQQAGQMLGGAKRSGVAGEINDSAPMVTG
jgi:hypothetical protein